MFVRALFFAGAVLVPAALVLSGCSTVSRCAGSFPKEDRPGVFGCKDVSMTAAEAETADRWRDEITGHIYTNAEACSSWTKKLEQAPADAPGLTQYVQIQRKEACGDKDRSERLAAARAVTDGEAGKPWIALVNGEVASGTCDTGHREALEQVLMRLKTNLAMRRDEGGSLHMVSFVDHRIFVANDKGEAFDFADWSSQVHVFAIATMPIELDVHRGTEVVTLASPWKKMIHYRTTLMGAESNAGTVLQIVHPTLGEPPPLWGRQTIVGREPIALDTRAVVARQGERIKISVKGRGCSLLAVFRDLS